MSYPTRVATDVREKERASLIEHVAERLDAFAAVLAARRFIELRNGHDPKAYDAIRYDHAARLVDAVIALTKAPVRA